MGIALICINSIYMHTVRGENQNLLKGKGGMVFNFVILGAWDCIIKSSVKGLNLGTET